jgi:hypothetical protein
VQAPGCDNVAMFGSHRTDWLVLGLARWFEDYVYDDIDSYRWDVPQPAGEYPPVLTAGVAAYPNKSRPLTDPYKRALFWKLIGKYYVIRPADVLVAKLSEDPTGLGALEKELPLWSHTPPGLFAGEAGFEIARMLVAYSLITQGDGDVSAIDPGAPPLRFETPRRTLTPSAATAPGQYPPTAQASLWLPPASVAAVRIAAVTPLPAGASVTVTLTPSGDTVALWAAPKPGQSLGGATEFLATTQPKTYTYGESGSAPEQFVAVVNPSFTDATQVEVLAAITYPRPPGVNLDFEADDPFFKCGRWSGHLDAAVVATNGDRLTVKLVQDTGHPNELVLDIYGGAATSPAITIAGTYTFEPVNNPSDHCPVAGGDYYVYTYSPPAALKGAMYNFRTDTWFPSMGPFTLGEPAGWAGDSLEIYWHVSRDRFTAEGTHVGKTDELGDLPYGYAGIYRRSGTPP